MPATDVIKSNAVIQADVQAIAAELGDIHDKDLSRKNTPLLTFNRRIFLKNGMLRTAARCCGSVDRDS
jgi:hypothetical protein